MSSCDSIAFGHSSMTACSDAAAVVPVAARENVSCRRTCSPPASAVADTRRKALPGRLPTVVGSEGAWVSTGGAAVGVGDSLDGAGVGVPPVTQPARARATTSAVNPVRTEDERRIPRFCQPVGLPAKGTRSPWRRLTMRTGAVGFGASIILPFPR